MAYAFDVPNERRKALLDEMDGNDIPGPDGSGGFGGFTTQPVIGAPSAEVPIASGFGVGEYNPNAPTPRVPARQKAVPRQEAEPQRAGAAPQTSSDPFAFPTGATVDQAMQMANDAAYGYNKHQDANYWRDMWAKDPEYTWKRMIGMGAGPQDAAKYGEWAGGDPNAEQIGGGGGSAAPARGTGQPFNLEPIQGLDLGAIMQELQALIGGQSSPMQRSAILSQLKG